MTALMNVNNINEAILKIIHGFSVLPATPELTESEVKLLNSDEKEFHLKSTIMPIHESYDYVLMELSSIS